MLIKLDEKLLRYAASLANAVPICSNTAVSAPVNNVEVRACDSNRRDSYSAAPSV